LIARFPEIAGHVSIVKQSKNINERRVLEKSFFDHIRKSQQTHDENLFLADINWVKNWISFLQGQTDAVPGKISNEGLHRKYFQQRQAISVSEDFFFMTEKLWLFLYSLYGGHPHIKKNTEIPSERNKIQGKELTTEASKLEKVHSRQKSVGAQLHKHVQILKDPSEQVKFKKLN
jgi:hypothetical protein